MKTLELIFTIGMLAAIACMAYVVKQVYAACHKGGEEFETILPTYANVGYAGMTLVALTNLGVTMMTRGPERQYPVLLNSSLLILFVVSFLVSLTSTTAMAERGVRIGTVLFPYDSVLFSWQGASRDGKKALLHIRAGSRSLHFKVPYAQAERIKGIVAGRANPA